MKEIAKEARNALPKDVSERFLKGWKMSLREGVKTLTPLHQTPMQTTNGIYDTSNSARALSSEATSTRKHISAHEF